MKGKLLIGRLLLLLLLSGCVTNGTDGGLSAEADEINIEIATGIQNAETAAATAAETAKEAGNQAMTLAIDGTEVTVAWENNESVDALRELVREQPLSVSMSMYGGFEQVGFLGTRLPQDDEQTTTSAGDIVLYSGNQIVIFYGSNTWAYTPLGKITGLSQDELRSLLGNGDVTIALTGFSPQGS